ncbi:MAG: hypothetical protein CVV06_10415 [Gammaproteobacteria bacterium HGW-Gammaproteobacteria-10]|nr:MAG: hypothetical protein CVV06_10415 [Gammaproteobacteria bacterium HGW-Gammaproteobacteria-10]
MYLLIALATLIGILLGLLGGGGSILTVPVLVYVVDLSAKDAIVTSLVVVGLTSIIAVINHARHGFVCWKTGFTFGAAGMAGAFLGGRSSAFIPGPILLVLFAVVMIMASFSMLRGKRGVSEVAVEETDTSKNLCKIHLPVMAILFDGFLVGFVTGLVGVGGGFLLVPALNFLAGLPMHAAIGTSLFIIVLQAGAALAGHADHMHIDIELTALVAVFAILGSLIGSFASSKIDSRYLKPAFGLFVLGLGSFILYRETDMAMIEQIRQLAQKHQDFLFGGLAMIAIMLFYRLWLFLHSFRSNKST